MSSEWGTYKLGEVGRIVTGKTPATGNPSFQGIDVAFVTPPDFSGDKWITHSTRMISELGAQSVKNSILPPKSVLVTCIGSDMGKTALSGNRCVTNQQINAVVVDETKFYPEFIYYNLSLRKDEIKGIAGGSAQPILNKSAFSEIRIDCPALEVQQEIVEALRPFDDRIALLRETNATLEAIAQALFKSWFVGFDPVHAKARGEQPQEMDEATAALFPDSFEESELGMIPKGWQVSKIEDLMELAYGKALKATDRISGPIPVYGSGGITGYHNKSLVDGASIIVGRKGTVGSLYWEDRPFFPIDTVFYVRTSKPLTYCYYLLKTLGLEDMNTDGAVPGLNRNNVYRLQFVFPSDDTLLAFNNIVSALRNRIYSNNEQAQTLAQLRDTLLP